MTCIACKVSKLAEEFPPYNGSDKCDHACLTCLRCLVNYVCENGICPYPDCGVKIDSSSEHIVFFKEILSQMFTEYETTYTPMVDISGGNQFVTVTGLTGESVRIKLNPSMTVLDLKIEIQKKLGHEPKKQKLLFNESEMAVANSSGGCALLSEYEVKTNATIYLVVCLYSIPDNLDHVIFDLHWNYPVSTVKYKGIFAALFGGHSKETFCRDYLDATCFMFNGTKFCNVVDYCHSENSGIQHSGDIMDDKNHTGHHTIDVRIRKIPKDVTHLFFTLSSFISPDISKFPNPTLKFYDASNKEKDLCNTTITHAQCSQAVIMCSVSKKTGMWQIFESGKLSAGNAMNYEPLIETIQKLIQSGC